MADGVYSGLTIEEITKMILWELGQVTGTTVTYNRFPQWLVRSKITERQNIFVKETNCIRKMALILCKANYSLYKLPTNCIDGGLITAKYYIDSTNYANLEIVDSEYLDEHRDGWRTADGGDPEYILMGETYGNTPMIKVYPEPYADGTSYAISPDTGVAIGGDLPTATNNVTGAATGGSDTELDDTAVDFTAMGLTAGMYVKNVTDGSCGYILTIATTKLTLASALTGGSANTFTAGDSYEVLAGEYGVLTSWTDSEQYIFAQEAGLLSSITVPAGNIYIEYTPYPNSIPATGNDDQYPDIPKLYHSALAYGVVADLLGTFHEKTREFSRAAAYEQKWMKYLAEAASKKRSRPFDRKPSNIVPRIRR